MSDAAKRTVRTAVQTLVGLLVLVPSATGSAGLPGLARDLPWAAGAVAVAGALSRLMAVPGVQALLPGWLRTAIPVNADQALLDLPGPVSPAAPDAAEGAAASATPVGFGFTVDSGSGSDPAPASAPGSVPGSAPASVPGAAPAAPPSQGGGA